MPFPFLWTLKKSYIWRGAGGRNISAPKIACFVVSKLHTHCSVKEIIFPIVRFWVLARLPLETTLSRFSNAIVDGDHIFVVPASLLNSIIWLTDHMNKVYYDQFLDKFRIPFWSPDISICDFLSENQGQHQQPETIDPIKTKTQ